MDDSLNKQLERERLLNQVTTQIRQSLDLSVILSTAVQQLREFLQVDRLVIYQLNSYQVQTGDHTKDLSPDVDEPDLNTEIPVPQADRHDQIHGSITYEAKSSDAIASLLDWEEADRCFAQVPEYQQYYQKSIIHCIPNIKLYYQSSPELYSILQQKQVTAQLVAPILVQKQLWGILIAHQCFSDRQWKESEQKFISKITQHLSIAIYQAQLYAQVQQQKQTLERRVKERTQALHDALLAAQCANRAKSEFLATMSHELRTPLTHVIGISSTLLRLYSQPENFPALPLEKQKHYLQTIHDSGENLLALINDILDLSQVESGKTVLKFSEFSLQKLAQQCLHTLRDFAKEKGVNVNLQIKVDQDLFRADYRRVRQILLNLLSNAIKFTPKGGRVTLTVSRKDKTAIFQVKDTGIGISKEQQSLLFEKFQQLDSPYRRQYGGTGLGLALTKQLVELHGGSIQFESEVGLGTKFTVYIPIQPLINKSSSNYKTSLPSMYTDTPQGRLVLIEDDEETATLICELLTAAGYQVVWLMDGLTALATIQLLKPDAIFIDLHISGQDGYDIVRHLREDATTQKIKIVALTTNSDEQEQSLQFGVDKCLNKPILPNQLLNQVESLNLGMGTKNYD